MKSLDFILLGSAILIAWLTTLVLFRNVNFTSDDFLTMNLINMFLEISFFVLFFGVALILMGILKYAVVRFRSKQN